MLAATYDPQNIEDDAFDTDNHTDGTTNIFRNYWPNQATGLVNDVPGEIMLTPNLWSDITFQ